MNAGIIDEDCFDYVEIRDGHDENAPLIARVTGDATDQINTHDTFTSTGRNMWVKFHTDGGNGALGHGADHPTAPWATTADPGFYAEWQIVDDGQECERFVRIPNTAIRGHNNEQLLDVTPADCEAACCARACSTNWNHSCLALFCMYQTKIFKVLAVIYAAAASHYCLVTTQGASRSITLVRTRLPAVACLLTATSQMSTGHATWVKRLHLLTGYFMKNLRQPSQTQHTHHSVRLAAQRCCQTSPET